MTWFFLEKKFVSECEFNILLKIDQSIFRIVKLPFSKKIFRLNCTCSWNSNKIYSISINWMLLSCNTEWYATKKDHNLSLKKELWILNFHIQSNKIKCVLICGDWNFLSFRHSCDSGLYSILYVLVLISHMWWYYIAWIFV